MTRTARGTLSRLVLPAAAVIALGYLAAMVVTGAMPQQRQLVRFEAKGVLTLQPAAVGRVRLVAGGQELELLHAGEGAWTRAGGGALDPAAASQVETALKVMHRSGPVREIAAAELAGVDTAPFGLDDPALVAAVYGTGGVPALTARFGATNPEGILQYMRLDGDPRVYLMSRFVGGEWRSAFEAAGRR